MSFPKELSDAIDGAFAAMDRRLIQNIEMLYPASKQKALVLLEAKLFNSIIPGQSACDFCGGAATCCLDVLESGEDYTSLYACDNHLSELLGEDSV